MWRAGRTHHVRGEGSTNGGASVWVPLVSCEPLCQACLPRRLQQVRVPSGSEGAWYILRWFCERSRAPSDMKLHRRHRFTAVMQTRGHPILKRGCELVCARRSGWGHPATVACGWPAQGRTVFPRSTILHDGHWVLLRSSPGCRTVIRETASSSGVPAQAGCSIVCTPVNQEATLAAELRCASLQTHGETAHITVNSTLNGNTCIPCEEAHAPIRGALKGPSQTEL